MNRFTPQVRKYAAVLITLIVICGIVATYLFLYVTKNKDVILQRDFRSLDRTTANLNNSIPNYAHLYSNDLQPQNDSPRDTSYYTNEIKKRFGDKLNYYSYDFTNHSGDSSLEQISVTQQHNQQYLVYKRRFANDSVQFTMGAGIKLVTFLTPLLQKDFFSNYILLKGTQVYYTDFPSGLNITNYDSLFNRKDFIKSNTSKEIKIGDTTYTLFIAPFNFNVANSGGWTLIGMEPSSTINTEMYSVSESYSFFVVFILIFLGLSFPFAKILLMNANERLKAIDLLTVYSCFILGFSLFIFVALEGYSLNWSDKSALDEQQKNIADSIKRSFLTDVTLANAMLDKSDSLLKRDSTYFRPIRIDTADIKRLSSYYPCFKLIFWLNSNAWDDAQWANNSNTTQPTNYSERSYFKDVKNQKFWNLPDRTGSFAFQPVYSWSDGSFRTVIAKKSICSFPSRKHGRDSVLTICISSQLPSVIDPVLPADYNFAVIDAKGNVQFHSVKTKNLNENFIEECNGNSTLRDAIADRASDYFDENYSGRQCRMYISPIENLPLYLVTIRDQQYFDTADMDVLSFSTLLAIALTIFNILQMVVFILISRWGSPWNLKTLQPVWLYPGKSYFKVYFHLSVINGFIFLLTCLAACFDIGLQTDYILLFNIFFSQSLFFYSMMVIKQGRTNIILRRFYYYFLFMLGLINISAWRNLDSSFEFSGLILYEVIVILISVGMIAGKIRIAESFPAQIKNWIQKFNEDKRYFKNYNLMLFSWLLLSAGLPVALIYKQAYDHELLVEGKFKLLQTARVINDRMSKDSKNYDTTFRPNRFASYGIRNIYGLTVGYPDSIDHEKCSAQTLHENESLAKLYQGVRFNLNDIGDQQRELIYSAESDSNALNWLLMKGCKHDSLKLVFNDWAYNRQQGAMTLKSGLEFYWFPIPFTGLEATAFWIYLLLACALVYFTIKFLTRRIFLVNYFRSKGKVNNHVYLKENILNKNEVFRRFYVIGISLSEMNIFLQGIMGSDVVSFDFAGLDSDEAWLASNQAISGNMGNKWIILEHFEYGMNNSKWNERKYHLLNGLLVQGIRNILITSALHPQVFLSGIKKDEIGTTATAESDSSALYEWNAILAPFEILIYQVQMGEKSMKNGRNAAGVQTLIARDSYYRAIWNSLELTERYLLYDLAEDGLANYKNRQSLYSLFDKGIIKCDDDCLPQISDPNFRGFILTEVKQDDIVLSDAARSKGSTWNKFRIPVYIIIIITLFLIFYTQEDVFNKVTAILASFAISVPILLKVFTLIPSGNSNRSS